MKKITIGARGSKLSLVYATKVKKLILEIDENFQEHNIEILKIKTLGDKLHDKKISEIGGKNLFCKEIEESLLKQKIDIAVHSLKDMEAKEDENLIIGAFLKRNDPRDVLIVKDLKKINKNIIIGSSSRRRQLQLKLINKNFSFSHLRGNIDTRIAKFENTNLDGIVLAAAGVKSLNFQNKIKKFFSYGEMLPAAGQGIIAAQCRQNDSKILKILNKINNEESKICAQAEREIIKEIGGNCDTAIGAFAQLENEKIKVKAQLFSDDGKKVYNYELEGDKFDSISLGKKIGRELLKLAGTQFKKK
tara:strand:+ start:3196 stop:4107 length:912 start_codon:yes stop_codon:yes gene_type:complete